MLEMMMGGKPKVSGVTYEQFVQWMTQNGFTEVPNGTAFSTRVGYAKVKLTAFTGTMWGTPWLNYYTYDSASNRVAQHAFPSAAVGQDNVTNQRYILIKTNYVGNRSSYQSLNRNGYTSPSYTSFSGSFCNDFVYWDPTLNTMMRVNPLAGSTPVPFNLATV